MPMENNKLIKEVPHLKVHKFNSKKELVLKLFPI